MTLAAFFVAMVGPMAARLLTAFGVTLITIAGAVGAVAALKSTLLEAVGAMPAAAIQLAGLFGLWTAAGMILGTYTFLLAYKSTAGFMALAKA